MSSSIRYAIGYALINENMNLAESMVSRVLQVIADSASSFWTNVLEGVSQLYKATDSCRGLL